MAVAAISYFCALLCRQLKREVDQQKCVECYSLQCAASEQLSSWGRHWLCFTTGPSVLRLPILNWMHAYEFGWSGRPRYTGVLHERRLFASLAGSICHCVLAQSLCPSRCGDSQELDCCNLSFSAPCSIVW